ncbi:M48 family metalloprotease [Pararhizobium haloflavum]|uniref:M48 family metalloprotease n=1 Tax=Pararhizobium haloflavum TaxID=2037914 RepID=UPI000C19E11E
MTARGRNVLRPRLLAILMLASATAGCQTSLSETDTVLLTPSQSPQTVEQLSRDDPRAQLGAREHPRIVASYGGEYKDQRTELLLARIVGKLTEVSENPQQTYRVTVLNSPAINAFALPGGYLYITRGLLALANDSAEIAAVISHEMAHVTANHGIERQRREEAEEIASRVVSEVLSGDLAGRQALARGQMRLAAFSRNQELQADVIGIRMLGEAGYDPYAAARFLESMAAFSRYRTAEPDDDPQMDFLASHPNAPQRIELARRHARAFGPEGVGDRDRDRYLDGISGLLFGDSPDEGYVRGRTFLHPRLKIRFDVPEGFEIDNTAEAVLATGPRDVAIRFDGVEAERGVGLQDYIRSGWVTGLDESSITTLDVNGLEAVSARAAADRWEFDVTVVRLDNQIYRFLTAAPRGSNDLQPTAAVLRRGFRELSAGEAVALQPLRVNVERAGPGDTVASLSRRMEGTDRPEALFRTLNGLGSAAGLAPGTRVKLIVD